MKIKSKYISQPLAGCGYRRQGKVYMYSDMKKHLEKYKFGYFVYDPPILIDDPTTWGICPQGISYIFKDGVYHAVDWIGVNNYPNAADILEEAFSMNGSGLVPLNPQIAKLTVGKSRRLLVHPRGYLNNNTSYKEKYLALERIPHCFRPKGKQQHKSPLVAEPCASLHWQTVTGGLPEIGRYVQRTIGSTTYKAVAPIEGDVLDHSLAIIGWLPIDELHLVQSEDNQEMDRIMKALKDIDPNIPVFLTGN